MRVLLTKGTPSAPESHPIQTHPRIPPAEAVCARQSLQEGRTEGPSRERRAIDGTPTPG